MNPYVLLGLSMTVALVSGIGTKLFLSRYNKGNATRYFFQSVTAALSVLILAVWSGSFKISLFTLLLGLCFGMLTAIQQIFCMKAMEIGPWSYTAVISSLATIIPTLSGALIWKERIAPIQIVGIVLMLACICLASNLKRSEGATSLRWMIYCGITFVATGFIGVLQKWHQSTEYKGELNEFLIVALSVSAIYSAVLTLIACRKEGKSAGIGTLFRVVPIITMVLSGVGVALNNQWNLYLSGVLDSSVMFPVVNGGGLMLTTVAATVVFRERLSLKQWIGLAIGLISVILLCNPF